MGGSTGLGFYSLSLVRLGAMILSTFHSSCSRAVCLTICGGRCQRLQSLLVMPCFEGPRSCCSGECRCATPVVLLVFRT